MYRNESVDGDFCVMCREVVVSLAGMGLFWFGDALAMDANDAKAA